MQAAPTTIGKRNATVKSMVRSVLLFFKVYTSQPMPQQPMAVGYAIPVRMGMPLVGEYPASLDCPNCRQHIVTRTVKKSGLATWLACGGLAFFGCILGCCFIPFCVDMGKVMTSPHEQCTRHDASLPVGYTALLSKLLNIPGRAQDAVSTAFLPMKSNAIVFVFLPNIDAFNKSKGV
jgi:hypothetical protein